MDADEMLLYVLQVADRDPGEFAELMNRLAPVLLAPSRAMHVASMLHYTVTQYPEVGRELLNVCHEHMVDCADQLDECPGAGNLHHQTGPSAPEYYCAACHYNQEEH